MQETSIKFFVGVCMPEWVKPVPMIDMSVAAHHLSVDALDIGLKRLWEARGLTKPV